MNAAGVADRLREIGDTVAAFGTAARRSSRAPPEGALLMEVRREKPSDVDAIRTVVEAAFPTKAEAALVDALRDSGDEAASVVAVESGMVIGHAMLSRMTGPFPIVGLAPVAVLPRWQRRQVGQQLLSRALDLVRADGWVAAFVLGDPRFYGRFGFSNELARGFRSRYAGPHFMVLPLSGSLPVRSGRVDYAPAFADLD